MGTRLDPRRTWLPLRVVYKRPVRPPSRHSICPYRFFASYTLLESTMTTRSSKAKALSLFSPLSRLFGSQRSSKSDTKAALDDSFTVVSLPQALSPPQRRGRSSSLGDLRPRPLNFPGRRETSPGSTLDLHPHNLLDIPAPQAVSPTEIEHVTSTSATLVDSPASGKSHSPINSGNSLSFSTVVHKIDGMWACYLPHKNIFSDCTQPTPRHNVKNLTAYLGRLTTPPKESQKGEQEEQSKLELPRSEMHYQR